MPKSAQTTISVLVMSGCVSDWRPKTFLVVTDNDEYNRGCTRHIDFSVFLKSLFEQTFDEQYIEVGLVSCQHKWHIIRGLSILESEDRWEG